MRTLPPISSPANPKVRDAVRLRDAAHRRRTGNLLVDGRREIALAARSGIRLRRLYVPAEEIELVGAEVAAWHAPASLEIQPLEGRAMEKVAYGQRGRDWVAVADQPQRTLNELDLGHAALVLVLDQFEKPGNIGACARTAAACGASALLVTDAVCDVFNPNAIRASRGALFAIPVVQTTSSEAYAYLIAHDIVPHCARVGGATSLWECELRQPVAICIGNETRGLGDRWQGESTLDYTIPMHAPVDSLNASITAAVSLYECMRQRRSG